MEEARAAVKVKDALVWVDLEMTGLDTRKDHILEMACLITDANLNIVAETDDLVIHQPDDVLDSMNDWCKTHHGASGLTQACRESKVSVAEAEERMLRFVEAHTQPGAAILAGNTVHADKGFLQVYMPRFMGHLHYRIMDVSTVKELCRRWYPETFAKAPPKAGSHRALEDIKESIKELQFYREHIFVPQDKTASPQ